MAGRTSLLLVAVLAALASPAAGQRSRTHPGTSYFVAVDELNSADYRQAERGFRSELRTAVKTVDARWVDSIIYAGALGEALYQQGRLEEALAEFDAAIDLYLQHADWLQKINFQQDPRDDANRARRQPDWAAATQPALLADVPRTALYAVGQVNQAEVLQRGGVVRMAQYWRLDAEELARSIAWTIYRRGELLGPLGKHDLRNRSLATRIAGGVGPAGHWSSAWTELWWGLAEGARGEALVAAPHLTQATLLAGRYAHRCGAIALLARGQLSEASGDTAAAAGAYRDAAAMAVAYDEPLVLAEVLRAWHTLALTEGKAAAPPLAAAAAWGERSGWRRLSIDARLALVERALLAGDAGDADAAIQNLFRRDRDAAAGLLGREGDRLRALAAATRGRTPEALGLAERAIAAQQAMSRRLLQSRVAVAWYDDGRLTPRVAREAFAALLGDPSGWAWRTSPLDVLAAGAAPQTAAFQRWFAAAEDRREPLLALQVIDQQRRHELLAARGLSGRRIAVRWVLEALDEQLPPAAIEARSAIDRLAPEYHALRLEGADAEKALREAVADTSDEAAPAIKKAAEALRENVARREAVVARLALGRAPTPLVFPPQIDPVAAKASLSEGQALVAFHELGDACYGVLLTGEGEHLWRIGPTDRVATQVERLLKAVAGVGPRQSWSAEELAEGAWQAPAAELGQMLLGDSRLDAARLERLWVVPDGPVWRAPLAIVPIPVRDGGQAPTRLGDATMTYAPTPGWPFRPRRPAGEGEPGPVWAVAAEGAVDLTPSDPLARVAGAAAPPPALEVDALSLSTAPLGVFVRAAGQPVGLDPLGLPLLSARPGGQAAALAVLPHGGPRAMVLSGLGGGEAGGARKPRAREAGPAGAAELHLVGAVLAGGTDGLLVERWQSGGRRAGELAAEWLLGFERLGAAAAWERSLALGRTTPLDPAAEPRLTVEPGQTPAAEHPFWWAGFFVVD
ncbi:hypothetical protein [Botrimarina sp.]|uniref:hypothetical protein n=1 Tax=Botrimarina sp. TaxID=2795802 RepID=UPI0032EED8B9